MLRLTVFSLAFLINTFLFAQTPMMVKDIYPGINGSGFYRSVTSIGDVAYFMANDDVHGYELWRSDSTASGTYLVKDITPGSGGSAINGFINMNGVLYFGVTNTSYVAELWRSDGTEAGTYMVKDISPGDRSGGSGFYEFINVNGVLYFGVNDGIHGIELWRSDGTTAGTHLLKDINPGKATSLSPRDPTHKVVDIDGIAYFQAYDGGPRIGLWRSDGTEAGTLMVKPIYISSYIYNVNGLAFFWGSDGINGYKLWRSDGTEAGTYMIKDISPSDGVDGLFTRITIINGVAYFCAADPLGEKVALWRSDGTEVGTYIIKNNYLSVSSYKKDPELTYVKGILYFAAADEVERKSGLWRSDGTAKGTYLVKNVDFPRDYLMTGINGLIYFGANDGVHGTELWRSDGTPGGTYMLKDIFPGSAGSSGDITDAAYIITDIKGVAYFGANDGIHGAELWRSDGTTEGTYLVKDIYPGSTGSNTDVYNINYSITIINGVAYFGANDGVHGTELWKLESVTIRHFHQVSQSSLFQSRHLLGSGTDVKVCADGSKASVFKIAAGGYNYSQAIIKIEGPDITQTGSFTVDQSRDSLIVYYKHPDYIQTSGTSVTLVASIYATPTSPSPITTINIIAYRAPVLMVHGIWSGSETFSIMEDSLIRSLKYPASSPNLIRRADYSTTNSLAFAFNIPKIKTEIDLLIRSIRDAGVAAGNVDYIGHSMGGVLGRLYLQGDTYQCGFHKLITLNTPHSGSEVANLLNRAALILPKIVGSVCRNIIPLVSYATGDACAGGAIDNLQVDSPEITRTLNGIRRNYRTVSSHAIATVEYQTPEEIINTFFGESLVPDNIEFVAKKISKKLVKLIDQVNKYNDILSLADISMHLALDFATDRLFGGLNDRIVSQISQQGGLPGKCTTTIINQAHTGSPENELVIKQVQSLLIAAPNSDSFCQSFSPITIGGPTPPLIIPNGTVSVTAPRRGQTLLAGASGTLSATGTDLTEIMALVEYSPTEIVAVRSTGNTVICTMPVSTQTGSKKVTIIGKTTSGGYVTDTTSFYVSNIINPEIDLALSLNPSTRVAQINQPVTYILHVRNQSTVPAGNQVSATWENRLPPNLQFISGNNITHTNGVLTGMVSNLKGGQSAIFQFQAKPTVAGSYRNAVQLITASNPDPDSRPGSGTADGEDDASIADIRTIETSNAVFTSPNPNQLPLPQVINNQPPADLTKADLSLHMWANTTAPKLNDVVSYTLTVSNRGGVGVINTQLTSQLSEGLLFIGGAGWTVNNGLLSCRVDSIPVNGFISVSFQARVVSSGLLTCQSQIMASSVGDSDSTPGNGYTNGEDDTSRISIRVR